MIRETVHTPEDPDYAREYRYATTGACTVARVWADVYGGVWIDGQRVVVPAEIRRLVARRVREAQLR